VNRLAPILGFEGIVGGRSKTLRVPDASLPLTARGKPATRVQRVCLGNIPFKIAAGFPTALRMHLAQAIDTYTGNVMPNGAPKLARKT